MPNQLARSKRRLSVAEHKAVLAAVAVISRRENTPVVALIREAIRELVKRRVKDPTNKELIHSVVWKLAPRIVVSMRTPTQIKRVKREQREFDQVLLDLHFATPSEIQARNSIAHPDQPIRMIDFPGLKLEEVKS